MQKPGKLKKTDRTISSKSESAPYCENGITKRLIEKYKPSKLLKMTDAEMRSTHAKRAA